MGKIAAEPAPPTVVAADERTDEALVNAARAGDRAAFAVLYKRWARPVHAVVLARAPVADAHDIVQDAFVIAMRRLDGLHEPAAFGGWLLMIARNRATDYRRRARTISELPPDIGVPAPPSAEAAEVLDVIRGLPEAYRETLLMRLLQGMSGPEIAERTGLSPGSVRVNLHRGMALLREALGWESSR